MGVAAPAGVTGRGRSSVLDVGSRGSPQPLVGRIGVSDDLCRAATLYDTARVQHDDLVKVQAVQVGKAMGDQDDGLVGARPHEVPRHRAAVGSTRPAVGSSSSSTGRRARARCSHRSW